MQQQVFGDYAFSVQVQLQFLNMMAHNENFLCFAQELPMRLTDFTLPACQLVYEVLDSYYRRYSHVPSLDTLATAVAHAAQTGENVQTQLTPEEYESLANVISHLYTPPTLDEDYLQDNVVRYVKDVRYKQIVSRHSDAIARGFSSTDVLSELNALEAIKPKLSDIRQASAMEDSHHALIWKDEDIARIPTGIRALDSRIMGGLSAATNELGCAMACTGVGKTNFLLNVALGAALHGVHVCFITLELPIELLQRRYLAMAAHINARHASSKVSDTWTNSELIRYDVARKMPFGRNVTVYEMLGRDFSLSDVDAVINTWKQYVARHFGAEDRCLLVCLDWLDMLVPSLKGRSRNYESEADWSSLGRTTHELKQVMARHRPMACWTVTQGNRGSVRTDLIRMDHTASSFQKMWYLSVALGITAPIEDAYAEEHTDDDDMESESELDCNRHLKFTLMKNREGNKRTVTLFQGPTLKLWRSQGHWIQTKRLLDDGDMQKIFGGPVEYTQ